jgi:hypothetical protein
MGTFIYFTDDQKLRANSVDIVELLRRRGEKLIRSGREYRLASDHSVTVRGNEWFDHGDERGGHAVSFVRKHYGLSYPDAVILLLGGEQGATYPPAPEREAELPKPFALPPAHSDMRRVYAYLMKQRNIDREIISVFSKAGLLYEDAEYHNCVFVGMDENGVPRHAHKRSVNSIGEAFRINVEGSLPQYSFHHIGTGDRLYVFEGPIDLLSFITLYPMGWQEHSYVALCGTGSQAMMWMLEQNPGIRHVALCLDNDKAGQKAARRLSLGLQEAGYQYDILPPKFKDWNDDLCAERGIPRAGLEIKMR